MGITPSVLQNTCSICSGLNSCEESTCFLCKSKNSVRKFDNLEEKSDR